MSRKKNIAIVGSGFVGLSSAWELLKNDYNVTLFEASDLPGGLASGFERDNWSWSLERHYHHIFETDLAIKKMIIDLGLDNEVFFLNTKSEVLYKGKQYQLDSPLSLLGFTPISFFSRLRTGMVLAFFKLFPYGIMLERFTARNFLIKSMGLESWNVIWKPLFEGKFGVFTNKINASWIWARIFSRSKKLGYFKGGFLSFSQKIVEKLEEKGARIFFSTQVLEIKKNNNEFSLITKNSDGKIKKQSFDQVLVTTPSSIFTKIAKDLPIEYVEKLSKLKGLGAITLIFELKKEFLKSGTYWLNINEKSWPFLAVVEHTNFINKDNYDGNSLLYVGKYLSAHEEQYKLNKDNLIKLYRPFLEKVSPDFYKNILNSWLFKESFAQPIVEIGHRKNLPEFTTPVTNLYWASMQHVYPWDRGTNFAVKAGYDVAKLIIDL